MKGPLLLLAIALHLSTDAMSVADPKVFSLSPGALQKAKATIAAGDKSAQPALQKLVSEANAALKVKASSVMDKTKNPASGDKHDYLSTAPYFWPDPSKPDGLPYIRKDGERNPESHNSASDSPRMGRMAGNAWTLALAWYLTANENYSEHAAKLLRVWFLDPATRMNPNFNFAQAIPGMNTGRGTGMIESRSLTAVMDAVGLLQGSKHWSKADQEGMTQWIAQFLDWARTSKNGKDEAAAKNNHGTFYDVQITHMALFLGKLDLAREIIESAKTNRLPTQIKTDGSQPLELARADSFGYSQFNLQAWFQLATLAEHLEVDLWRYKTVDGVGIRTGLDFLVPYVESPDKKWPYGKKGNPNLNSLLRHAWLVYRDDRYRKLIDSRSENQREALFYPLK